MNGGEKFDYVSFCIMLLMLEFAMFVVGGILSSIAGEMETWEVGMFLLLSLFFWGINEGLTHITNKLSANNQK